MLEVTIHVPGLEALAAAIASFAGEKDKLLSVKNAVVSQVAPISVPTPAQASQTTPVGIPVASQTPPVGVAGTAPAPASVAVLTASHAYTADELARAAMTLMDAGKQMDLIQLLASFGVNSIPALPPEQMGAFATALRGLGAQI